MKGRFREYGDRDLPALGSLFARADSHDGVARALAPDAADELPLFAFAPRYPLGLERGLTRAEVRSRLGSRLAEVERLVLVAARGRCRRCLRNGLPVRLRSAVDARLGGGPWEAGDGSTR